MEAMAMPGLATVYDPRLVALSVVIAVAAATAALWLTFRRLGSWTRLGAAIVMGIAISGMHYTGMAAATFVHVEGQHASLRPSLDSGFLALAVVAATSLLLVIGLLGAFFDRKLAALTAHEAAALRHSEERYRALVEYSSDIVLIADRDCRIVYESPSAHPILGYGPGTLVGRRLGELVDEQERGALDSFLTLVQQSPAKIDATELRLRHVEGAWFDFEVVGNNLLEEQAVAGIVLTLRDVTERKRLLHALEKLSETDPLTNTLNRRGFMKLGEREIERVHRYGGALAVVMLDVDHFKAVNDTYGHAAGDLVLAKVADVCRGEIREADMLCRYGGEEFVVLLMEADLPSASLVVERLRQSVEAARVHSIKGDVRVTASFGVAIVDPTTCELEGALRLADEALYDAKSSGRNCMKSRASVVNG
jgi:diguanylate cyclase (GGDEF)-like protein/PAS domain S-box-containing protein